VIELPSPSGFEAMMTEFRAFRVEIRTEISTMTGYCKDAADNSMLAVSEGRIGLAEVRAEQAKTNRRVAVLELRRQIIPALAYLVTTVIATWALYRTYR
jgi:hypothetical protein